MADKQKCKKGCGKQAVKDGLCYKDYKAEHGVAPSWAGGKVEAKKNKPAKSPKINKLPIERKPRKASVSQSPRRNGEVIPASYLVEIDFTAYPKLHDRLLDLSSKEHRSPDMQLVHMLDETLSQAEAGAGK